MQLNAVSVHAIEKSLRWVIRIVWRHDDSRVPEAHATAIFNALRHMLHKLAGRWQDESSHGECRRLGDEAVLYGAITL
jgi:predicted transposase YbfD/YdcC